MNLISTHQFIRHNLFPYLSKFPITRFNIPSTSIQPMNPTSYFITSSPPFSPNHPSNPTVDPISSNTPRSRTQSRRHRRRNLTPQPVPTSSLSLTSTNNTQSARNLQQDLDQPSAGPIRRTRFANLYDNPPSTTTTTLPPYHVTTLSSDPNYNTPAFPPPTTFPQLT